MEGFRFEHFHNATTENPAATARFERGLICFDCGLICPLLTSNSILNPGRKYYKCLPHNSSFRWADTVKPHEFIEVPYCGGCSAGLCRVKKETHGPNAGRIMFLCRVKEGEGSCGYRKWQDELLEEGQAEESMNLLKTSSTVTDMVKDSQQRDERTDPVSPLFESSDYLLCPGVASQTMNQEITARKMDRLTCPEGNTIITSRKPHKRSRCVDIPDSNFPNSGSMMTVSLGLHSMSTRNCWITDAIGQNFSTELNGWWRRLVFRPMQFLQVGTIYYNFGFSHPVLATVSYPLESTFMGQDISVNSSGSITLVRDSKGVESYTNLSFNLEHHHNPLDSTYAVQDKILVNSSGATTSARSCLSESNSNNNKCLNALHDEIVSTMDWPFHIEVEAYCCELEMKNLELQLENISKKKEELEGKYLIAFKSLEESQKLFEQKEAEYNAAKAAFNRARALLRGG